MEGCVHGRLAVRGPALLGPIAGSEGLPAIELPAIELERAEVTLRPGKV